MFEDNESIDLIILILFMWKSRQRKKLLSILSTQFYNSLKPPIDIFAVSKHFLKIKVLTLNGSVKSWS